MTSEALLATPSSVAWIRLLFTPERSPQVAREQWHPLQESQVHPDGSYELSIPYSDDPQLLDDILSFGPDVEVLAPQDLRQKVQRRLLAAAGRYVGGADQAIFP